MKNDELQLLLGACRGAVSRMLIAIQGLPAQDAAEFLNITGITNLLTNVFYVIRQDREQVYGKWRKRQIYYKVSYHCLYYRFMGRNQVMVTI